MPVLTVMICEQPRVYGAAGLVHVDVTASGQVVNRVGFSPHIALALGKALQAEAVRLIEEQNAGAVVEFKREA